MKLNASNVKACLVLSVDVKVKCALVGFKFFSLCGVFDFHLQNCDILSEKKLK